MLNGQRALKNREVAGGRPRGHGAVWAGGVQGHRLARSMAYECRWAGGHGLGGGGMHVLVRGKDGRQVVQGARMVCFGLRLGLRL